MSYHPYAHLTEPGSAAAAEKEKEAEASAGPPSYGDVVKQPPPPVQQVPYLQPPVPMQIMTPPSQAVMVVSKPSYLGPHDFLILSVSVVVVCGILNFTSVAFGIPAIILASLSKVKKGSLQYPSAKIYANVALAFIIIDLVYTLSIIDIAIGLMLGLWYRDGCNYMYSLFDGLSYNCPGPFS